MRTKGIGPNGLGVPKGSPFKVDPATVVKVASMAKGAKGDGGGQKAAPKKEEVGDVDPFAGVPFKGSNSSNSDCWDSKVKIGTKPSPTRPGVTVNDCVDPSDPRAKNK